MNTLELPGGSAQWRIQRGASGPAAPSLKKKKKKEGKKKGKEKKGKKRKGERES